MARDLRALPKAHLHLHLDGAVRPSTLAELAAARGLPVPIVPDAHRYDSFAAFTSVIETVHAFLADEDALSRVVSEVVADAAADGAVWIEVSVWPGVFDANVALSREEWVGLLLEAGRRASEARHCGFGVMLAVNRHRPPSDALEVAELAAGLAGQGVVSFGLDGDEGGHPAPPAKAS